MKRTELSEYIKETIVELLSEVSQDDVETQKDYNAELEKTAKLSKEVGLTEEDDVEPTAKDIDKKDSITVISRQLQNITKDMKTVVGKWKKAEGSEKEALLARLKDLTKIKKELEGLL
tara:strand:+ start:136 stop:489 length:354 start_codon:yes stop_codon:yes gene_type:complete